MLLRNNSVYLRFLRKNDAAACFQAICESRHELSRFTIFPSQIKSVADESAFIERSQFMRKNKRGYVFGIFDLHNRSYIGGVGLHSVNPANRSGEIGYWIRESRVGQGIATAASALVLRFAFGVLKLHKINLRAATDNHASLRVAEKLGFVKEGVQRHEHRFDRGWVDFCCFSMLDTEYRRLKPTIDRLAKGEDNLGSKKHGLVAKVTVN